ncbi:MAG TPA: hypothetical protein VMW94_06940 [Actinomycetes bacterium]|nr:hypothetical protein [Actinomycetes bacterium]
MTVATFAAMATTIDWSAGTWPHVAHRRAGGRRRYNKLRQDQAAIRRMEVVMLLREFGGWNWGVQKRIAKELGVSEATISRDLRRLWLGP